MLTRPKNDPMGGQRVLITGGTGSFGAAFIRMTLKELNPEKLIVFSRDEWKQSELKKKIPDPPCASSWVTYETKKDFTALLTVLIFWSMPPL